MWKITFCGLKQGNDYENRVAHPTRNSQEYVPPALKTDCTKILALEGETTNSNDNFNFNCNQFSNAGGNIWLQSAITCSLLLVYEHM